jgi:hypothetical protein
VTTAAIPLLPGAAILPDGSASNAAPALLRVKSSAAAPAPYFLQLAFDASTKEQVSWQTRVPDNYASGPVLECWFKMTSATTGNVIIEGRLAAITDGDATDADAKAYGTANTSSATAVPGTAGYVKKISLTLTNADSVAAGDWVSIYLARDAANGSDTATGDMEVVMAALSYTTT